MDLEQRLAAAEAELAAIKAEMANKDEWPKLGETYFYRMASGVINYTNWDGGKFDTDCKSIGNIFRTRQEAEAELEARKVIAELRQCDGYRPFVPSSSNYALCADLSRNSLYSVELYEADRGWQSIYFESDDATMSAIEKVGRDRIIKAARWLAMREV